jgi:hypothetical protein
MFESQAVSPSTSEVQNLLASTITDRIAGQPHSRTAYSSGKCAAFQLLDVTDPESCRLPMSRSSPPFNKYQFLQSDVRSVQRLVLLLSPPIRKTILNNQATLLPDRGSKLTT